MRWFKHDATANADAKLMRVRHKYGIVGYGMYWYCLELIAGGVSTKNITFELEHDAETIALEWNLDQMKVQEIMGFMVNIGLFEQSDGGRITCLKLAMRLDDSNAKNPQIREIIKNYTAHKIPKNSESVGKIRKNSESVGKIPKNSESVGKIPARLDKIRLDEKKTNKPKAAATALPLGINAAAWAEWIEYRKQRRVKMTPATITKQMCFLLTLTESDQALVIEQSIRNGWAGLFNLKTESRRPVAGNSTRATSLADDLNDNTWAN